ncbi:MAG: hypothetical protein RJA57_1713 [Bacteroidota bacterium]|jgi:hypothetical protein
MKSDPEERAPLFGSWTPWYFLVIGFLLLLIILFDRFTQLFTR